MARGVVDYTDKSLKVYLLKNVAVLGAVLVFSVTLKPYFVAGSVGTVFLAQLGALVVLRIFYSVASYLYRKFVRKPKDVLSYGKWAVVTGSTSGIGEAFCHELASRGMSVLQISRNEEKLKSVAKDVKAKHQGKTIEIRHMVHDFANQNTEYVEKFHSALRGTLETLTENGGVGMLLNCVGVSNSTPGLTHDTPKEDVLQMLAINNNGTTLMMQSVLPFMMKRKSGAVITVSSGSCTHPTPLLSIYSATKAFGNQLTRSMYYEYKEHGIDCLSITPYYFISGMFKMRKATFCAPFPQTLVVQSLPLLGYEAEAYPYVGHALNKLQMYTPTEYPFRLLNRMKNIRARALARAAKKKK